MLKTGLVSISFRKLAVPDVLTLAADCGLEGIEWGGDVHVPVGDTAVAERVGKATRDAGLAVAAYGSYYRMGATDPAEFAAVLDGAAALRTRLIRVWCGNLGSDRATPADRRRVAEDALRIGALAERVGVTVACEWHGGTLTDTAASAQQLFDAVPASAIQTYWQPHQRMAHDDCLRDMDTALPRLRGVHVFEWDVATVERRPLGDGESKWPGYLQKAMQCPAATRGEDLFAMLEFVRGDDPQQLRRDAPVLRRWVDEVNAEVRPFGEPRDTA